MPRAWGSRIHDHLKAAENHAADIAPNPRRVPGLMPSSSQCGSGRGAKEPIFGRTDHGDCGMSSLDFRQLAHSSPSRAPRTGSALLRATLTSPRAMSDGPACRICGEVLPTAASLQHRKNCHATMSQIRLCEEADPGYESGREIHRRRSARAVSGEPTRRGCEWRTCGSSCPFSARV